MKEFGGKVTKDLQERYSKSPNWRDGKFQNLVETTMNLSFQSLPKLLYKQFCQNQDRIPAVPLPILPFNETEFLKSSDKVKFIWYGHSVLLMRISNKTLLIDPMLGPDASPIAPFSTKRFSNDTLAIIDQLPPIDLVLLTHDHYDHLDLKSIIKLKNKVKKFYVGLGVGRHLIHWGIDEKIITEFDWWDNENFEDISITYTPSRHFSGRGVNDRAKSIWGGWVFNNMIENIYFSGDGGYGNHFKAVGDKHGPFDIGFMECGQYNENWAQIHMHPDESAVAGIDAGVKVGVPVHWGGFALAQHTWMEPVEWFTKTATEKGLKAGTPLLGEIFTANDVTNNYWWESFKTKP